MYGQSAGSTASKNLDFIDDNKNGILGFHIWFVCACVVSPQRTKSVGLNVNMYSKGKREFDRTMG